MAEMSSSIVFDIGNTRISFGVFKGQDLRFERHLLTVKNVDDEHYSKLAESDLALAAQALGPGSRCVIASVVPLLTPIFERLIRSRLGLTSIVVGPKRCGGIALNVPKPETVGADRIANAVAAGRLYSMPALVVDFGTATTFDVVNEMGDYEGGIIAPGPDTALSALVERTAQLRKIEIEWPKQVLGKTTESAMQSGLVMGYMDLIDGLITRLNAERGELGTVIATGGLGSLFTQHSRYLKAYDPHLTLKGLNLIATYGE